MAMAIRRSSEVTIPSMAFDSLRDMTLAAASMSEATAGWLLITNSPRPRIDSMRDAFDTISAGNDAVLRNE